MSRKDTRGIIAEYREKLGSLVDDEELGLLISRMEGYMIDVLESSASDEASMDRATFETVSEYLVRSGLAYEAKLEESNGEYVLTATDHTWGRGAQPCGYVDGVLGEFMQRLIRIRTGRNYTFKVAYIRGKTVFSFIYGQPSE